VASSHLSARITGLPCDSPPAYPPPTGPGDCGGPPPVGDHGPAMSTRYLIIAALVTGLVILAASAIQLLMVR